MTLLFSLIYKWIDFIDIDCIYIIELYLLLDIYIAGTLYLLHLKFDFWIWFYKNVNITNCFLSKIVVKWWETFVKYVDERWNHYNQKYWWSSYKNISFFFFKLALNIFHGWNYCPTNALILIYRLLSCKIITIWNSWFYLIIALFWVLIIF